MFFQLALDEQSKRAESIDTIMRSFEDKLLDLQDVRLTVLCAMTHDMVLQTVAEEREGRLEFEEEIRQLIRVCWLLQLKELSACSGVPKGVLGSVRRLSETGADVNAPSVLACRCLFSQALKDIHTIEEVLRLEIQAISSSQLMFAT